MSVKRKHYKLVNAKDFEQVKKLFDAGLSAIQVSKFTGRGYGTIINLKMAKTFEDYKRIVHASVVKYEKKDVPNGSEKKMEKYSYPHIGAILMEINNNLIRLVRIVEQNQNSKILENKGFTHIFRRQ